MVTSALLALTAAVFVLAWSTGRAAANTTGTWTATGSMAVTATEGTYTATTLHDGKVLVAGGCTSTAVLNRAELYDPMTGTWSPTGSLNVARCNHVAALLEDGRVLVAGGTVGPYQPTASAEVYDPATGQWTVTGSLNQPRMAFAATTLKNGTVLVSSGWTGNPLLYSSELYDPATGSWSYTGNVVTPRLYHTSVLLPDGRVMIAGGNSYGAPTAAVELYDPGTGQWSPTGSLSVPRSSGTPATVLPDGRVLVAGGLSSYYSPTFYSSAELYDPAAGTWSATGDMTIPRDGQTSTLLNNGKVLVSGGYGPSWSVLDSSELYDPASGTWSPDATMTTARSQATANLLPNGRVLVTGGYSPAGGLATAELYAPVLEPYSWSGFLQPVNSDGSSIFRLGRTVPVKFQLTGADTTVVDAVANLYLSKVSNNIEGSEIEAISTAAADTGNTFRYDPSAGQYIFNLDTRNLTVGTYRLKVYVKGDNNTGVLQGEVNISLR